MREAHSIKGGALNLTASALADAALALEQIGRSGNLDNAFEALENMALEFQHLEAFARGRNQQS
jgi:HPt (histidine-containing phosphotransfer) domain-containing protein